MMKILQVSATEQRGGASRNAHILYQGYAEHGHSSWLAVPKRESTDPNVFSIHQATIRERLAEPLIHRSQQLEQAGVRGSYRLRSILETLASATPQQLYHASLGHEVFDYPQSHRLMDLPPTPPDILQLHNLHGGYFDLRMLPKLSHRYPTILTLHDAWLLSGHCAHSFACDRWKTGCGHCPDLSIPPAIRRDATAYNWQQKQSIYQHSKVYVVTPSQWLMDKVAQSMLQTAVIDARVIPHSVDLDVYKVGDKASARRELGLPQEAFIILFAATSIRKSIWRDYQMMQAAVVQATENLDANQTMLYIGLGEDAPPETIGKASLQFVPYQSNPSDVAKYYQAADVYCHAARADTYPYVVLEAQACGTPVIATKVGGIPEQIKDLNHVADTQATGILVPLGDAGAMAQAINRLLDQELLVTLSRNAAQHMQQHTSQHNQITSYLDWFATMQ